MMLLVERDLAAPIGLGSGGASRQPRPSAQVGYGGAWREEHPSSPLPQRRADVHVLGVHEIALVEKAYGLQVRTPDQQAGAADPIHLALAPREAFDVAGNRPPPG